MPHITDLITTIAYTAVENKMLIIQSKETDQNTKINELENKITNDHDHDKFITTQ